MTNAGGTPLGSPSPTMQSGRRISCMPAQRVIANPIIRRSCVHHTPSVRHFSVMPHQWKPENALISKGKGSPWAFSITERRVPELIPVLGSQPAADVSHKPDGRLPLLSAKPAVTPATIKRAATMQFCCLVNKGTMGVNSLPKTVTRQRRDCDLNPGPSAPESSTLTTRLPSHPWRT